MNKVRGEIVYFLDDDVTIAPDLFARALDTFAQIPEVDVVGGPNLTPPASSLFEHNVGAVLASPFGSARVSARYRATGQLRSTDDRALILCNLAIRNRAIAHRHPVFEGDLVCNEENLLLGLLELENRRMLHDPALVVYHSRRGTVGGFARQIFKYGRGRWQNTLALPRSLSATFLLPSIFLLYLLMSAVRGVSWTPDSAGRLWRSAAWFRRVRGRPRPLDARVHAIPDSVSGLSPRVWCRADVAVRALGAACLWNHAPNPQPADPRAVTVGNHLGSTPHPFS